MTPKTILEKSGLVSSYKALTKYINFIENKKLANKIKHKTSYHHILPKAKDCFPEYKDLKIYEWNGAHLYHSDHLLAHELLLDVIDNFSIEYAYVKMTEKVIKENGKVNIEKYQLLKENVIKMNSGNYKSFIKKMKENGTYEKYLLSCNEKRQNSLNKIASNGKSVRENAMMLRSENVSRLDSNGLSIAKLGAAKANETKTKEIIINGKKTSIKKEAAKKFSKTIQEKVLYNGEYITKAKMRALKCWNIRLLNSQRYQLFHKDGTYYGVFYVRDINRIAPKLRKTTKETPLYMSDYLRSKKLRNSVYKGLYVEKYNGYEPNSDIEITLTKFSV